MLAHLVIDLLVAEVGLGSETRQLERIQHLRRIGIGVGYDGGDHHLHRREPQRQMPGVVLDQDGGEALERAEHGAMDHHRHRLLAVRPDIEGAEPHRHVEIDLDRAALPVAADRVAQHIFELRSVKGAFAGLNS